MVKRKIIKIDNEKCNGCGQCIPNCPEGAIQIIDEKARLISDIFCDGLGACIGYCPQGAIKIEEREAEIYDEKKVMNNIVKEGKNTIIAHLQHMKEHGEIEYLKEALEYLKNHNIQVDFEQKTEENTSQHQGCSGSQNIDFNKECKEQLIQLDKQSSQLRQWPVQMHLISPDASFFKHSDLLLVADCVGYSVDDFHNKFLKGKSLVIACPKLDSNTDVYIQKLVALIDNANINTITVITMQVPCCNGLLVLAKQANEQATRKIPIKHVIVNIKGEILKNEWI